MAIPAGFKLVSKTVDDPTPSPIPPGFRVVSQPEPEGQDFSITETIKNIPSSALQLGKDIIEPILSPIETAKSIGVLAQGVVEKGVKNIAAIVPEDVPIIGPAAAAIDLGVTENEEVANAVGDFINERYGSVDAFKATVQEDPVGVLADVAGLLTGGSTLVPKAGKIGAIGKAVETLGKAVDPLNISVSAVKAAAKATNAGKIIPQALPEKLLESALKFRPSIKPKQRASMTKTALAQGIMPTVSGLRDITDKLDVLNTSLDVIIDTATAEGKTIPKSAVFTKLKELRRDLGGVKVNAPADLKVIDKMAKEFDLNLRRLKKDRITPRELQGLKTDAYDRINFDVKAGTAEAAKSATAGAIAKGAKEAVEQLDPSVQGINRKMGDLLELKIELEKVVGRLDNRNLISLDTAAKIGGGGAAAGPAGATVGVAASVFGNPRVKARTALTLENLRKNTETIEIINNKLPPVLARTLLEQTGRLNDSLREQIEQEEN